MNHFEETKKIVNDSLFTLVVYNYTTRKKKRKYFASWAEEEVELFLFPFLFFLEIDFQDLH